MSVSDRKRSRPFRRCRRMPRQGLDPSSRKPRRSASRMITDRTGIDRSAAAGFAAREANHRTTSRRVISAIWRPANLGMICPRRYPRFTSIVRGFQIRRFLRNAASATASKTVSSGEAGTEPSRLIAAGIAAARERASPAPISSAPPTTRHTRLPSCWQCTKNRLRPDGIIRRPKPFSFASRMSCAALRGSSALIRASVSVTDFILLFSLAVAAGNRTHHGSCILQQI